jgi:hypothetical protein
MDDNFGQSWVAYYNAEVCPCPAPLLYPALPSQTVPP